MIDVTAYHNDPTLKTALLAEVRKHVEADQLVKGTYGKKNGTFKGCSVGCSIHSLNKLRGKTLAFDSHAGLAQELGITESLARLQDLIFERLPQAASQKWPGQFYAAIEAGSDQSLTHVRFLIAVQKRNLKLKEVQANEQVKAAIEGVLRVLLDWSKTGKPDARAASAAYRAADRAASAAYAGAYAADSAYRAYSAAASVYSAYSADSASVCAYRAYSAAASAAASVYSAYSADSASVCAYLWMAKTLLKLMREAPMGKP